MNIPTPRTDTAKLSLHTAYCMNDHTPVVDVDFARTLERELERYTNLSKDQQSFLEDHRKRLQQANEIIAEQAKTIDARNTEIVRLRTVITDQIINSPRLNELAKLNPAGRSAAILAHFKAVLATTEPPAR